MLNQTAGSAKVSSLRLLPQAGGASTKCILAYTLQGTFAHTYDLRAFPFDVQTLQARGVFWRSPLECVEVEPTTHQDDAVDMPRDVRPDFRTRDTECCTPFRGRLHMRFGRHMLYDEGFIQKDVWYADADDPVVVRPGHTDERYRSAGDGQRFSTLNIEITIRRRHQFYLLNVFLLFDVFSCLSLISFGVEIDLALVSDRVSIVLNQVLTAAAFKVVVSNMTPAVGYLTLIDAFILVCFIFMGACAVCAVVVSMALKQHNLAYAMSVNRSMGIALSGLWAACHVLFPVVMHLCATAHASRKARADAADAANRSRWQQFSLKAMTRHFSMAHLAHTPSSSNLARGEQLLAAADAKSNGGSNLQGGRHSS
jgi:hypothetical protein